MLTRKLYWADPYRQHFTARVLHIRHGDHPAVILNRTLFYPTGGGQPHDTGSLGEARVLDVIAEDGEILHVLDRLPEGQDELHGAIDWPRRWDHMQQHSGQHVLSALIEAHLQRPTIGFHLSEQSLTIDLPGPPPGGQELAEIIDRCQAIIAEDRPISSRLLDPQQAQVPGLRKQPDVNGPLRVVEIADLDRCACGGTHVRSTAAIGAIIVTKVERRGDQTRLHFLCGQRAWADYRRRLRITHQLGEQLTTGIDALPDAVGSLQDELKQAHRRLRNLQSQLARSMAQTLWAKAPRVQGLRLIRHVISDADAKNLGRLAGELTAQGQCLVMLALDAPRPRWMITRSADVDLDLSRFLPLIRAQADIKGGGNAHTVQGGAGSLSAIQALFDVLSSELRQAP